MKSESSNTKSQSSHDLYNVSSVEFYQIFTGEFSDS